MIYIKEKKNIYIFNRDTYELLLLQCM